MFVFVRNRKRNLSFSLQSTDLIILFFVPHTRPLIRRSITQTYTAWLIPSALSIVRYRGQVGDPMQYLFSNLTARDETYKVLMQTWEEVKGREKSEKRESGREEAGEKEKGKDGEGEKKGEKEREKEEEKVATKESESSLSPAPVHSSQLSSPSLASSHPSSSLSSHDTSPSLLSLSLSLSLLSLILACVYLHSLSAPLQQDLYSWSAANAHLEDNLLFVHSLFQFIAETNRSLPPSLSLSLPPPLPNGLREQVEKAKEKVEEMERDLDERERTLDAHLRTIERTSLLFSMRGGEGRAEGEGGAAGLWSLVLPFVGVVAAAMGAQRLMTTA